MQAFLAIVFQNFQQVNEFIGFLEKAKEWEKVISNHGEARGKMCALIPKIEWGQGKGEDRDGKNKETNKQKKSTRS